ncbi:hypothetical protein [Rhizobacter sp. Root16D2]|uniref:hypothetical protein n=1 Tax=Rhizobacter sp. Root16D2 TaxID=1736479 RepID=UPI0006F6D446|nr:hypothetical protein [Rhizobacter sp. Root16D2]KRB18632.1 hypothetical protein ASE08_05200 [Rhizobacter sp. Root16D2]
MSAAAWMHPVAADQPVSIKLIAQPTYWPQIDVGQREGGNPLIFQICVPNQDEVYLSEGQLASLVSSAKLFAIAPLPEVES